jgi:hypothetical protein
VKDVEVRPEEKWDYIVWNPKRHLLLASSVFADEFNPKKKKEPSRFQVLVMPQTAVIRHPLHPTTHINQCLRHRHVHRRQPPDLKTLFLRAARDTAIDLEVDLQCLYHPIVDYPVLRMGPRCPRDQEGRSGRELSGSFGREGPEHSDWEEWTGLEAVSRLHGIDEE